MPEGRRRRTPAVALAAALAGATAVMISPLTSWTVAVALHGLVLAVSGVAVLVWWLLRTW